jgi:hypothetical protein
VFIIGCFGLPWLWLVNCGYFYEKISSNQASPILKRCKNFFYLFFGYLFPCFILSVGFYLSLTGSIIAFSALFIWIITFQLCWRDWSNAKSYMIYVPEEDQNNW